MSVLVQCARCGGEWEVAYGESPDDLCRKCQRREERLAAGGHPLSGRERAAVAEFTGMVLPAGGSPMPVEGRAGAVVWGDERAVDFATLDGEKAAFL